jgi:hypothetical protein
VWWGWLIAFMQRKVSRRNEIGRTLENVGADEKREVCSLVDGMALY